VDLANLKVTMMEATREERPGLVEAPTRTPVPVPDPAVAMQPPREIGGRGGLDPTRYGDWEKAGRCIDF
jgi:hypothetical protein